MSLSAVLTGDIVASRDASAENLEAALSNLRDAAMDFGHEWHSDLRFTRFRGDGWQVLLTTPHLLLDAALYLTARLRAGGHGLNTRISAGVGEVTFAGTRDLSDASGPAFFISGDHLETMPKRRQLVVAGAGIGVWQTAVFDMVEQLSSNWSAAQAEVVALSLHDDPPTQADLAERLGITRQAVQSRLAGADLWALENARHAFRNHDFQRSSEAP